MRRKWTSIGIDKEIYVSSSMNYNIHVWLISDGGERLQLDYGDDGNWLYRKSRDFRIFDCPHYVEAMFIAKFAEMYAVNAFTFYEYRKMDNELVKDDDPQSLRYHDAEHWRWLAQSMIGAAAS